MVSLPLVVVIVNVHQPSMVELLFQIYRVPRHRRDFKWRGQRVPYVIIKLTNKKQIHKIKILCT